MKKIIILLAIALLANGCVTQKKRSDVSKVKKFYHDITAEFNGYFNATELYNGAILNLSEQEPENYNKLLPVYPYVAVENPATVAADMDEAIKKVTIVAALHDPSHWVDDCYLMAGKAQYLKQDYESAEETLEYLVAEFSPEALLDKKRKKSKAKPVSKKERQKVKKEKTKKRKDTQKEREKSAAQKRKEYKKERKRKNKEIARRRKAKKKGKTVPKQAEEVVAPKIEFEAPKEEEEAKKKAEEEAAAAKEEDNLDEPNGPFKHKPIHQEGQLWLARTYIERDKPDQAAYLMRQLKSNPNLYENVAREIPVLEAHFAFKEKKYNEAIPSLQAAIETAKERKDRARYTYILAQLQEMNGNSGEAYAYYEDVVKMRPEYEMEFSARMSMLLNKYRSGSASKEKTVKDLEKLTKDEKNIDYLDRIYFAIAEIYLQTSEEEEGVKYLELALEQGTTNKAQQAESFLKLATIYYEKEDYVKASKYYNQALPGISKNDERYSEIADRSSMLKEIATRITTIELQDSLIRMGQLSPDEKRAMAFEIKKKQDEDRRKLAIENALKAKNAPNKRGGRPAVGGNIAGGAQLATNKNDYWAYDDRSVKRGQRDFQKRWGERSLTDDWRRSSVQTGAESDLATDDEIDLSTSGLLTDEQVTEILRGVPQSKTQIEQATNKLSDAMFELGVLYRERMENNEKAIQTLEKLLREYPNTKHEPEALYHLHLAHKDEGNSVNAEKFKDRLIKDFPESPFAKILTDPNYAQKIKDKEREINDFYDETYQYFSNGDYQEAHNRLQQVTVKFGPTNPLQARFALLNAMTEGNLQGKDAYVKGLREVVAGYPKTEEEKRAKEILRLLGASSGSPIPGGSAEEQGDFKYEPEKLHYMIVVLDPQASLTDAKVKVSEFNRTYHKSDNLRISNIYLTPEGGERIPLIVLRRFKDAGDAMKYYKNVQLNASDFLKDSDYLLYPVTQENYRQILKNKSVQSYDVFFEGNYEK